MKIYTKTLTLFGLLFCSFISNGQNVHIPDQNFKDYLLAHTGINTVKDNEISEAEAEAYTGQMNVNNKNIQDLTGIEAFINISWLNCSDNNLNKLAISQNNKLTYLNFSNNNIEQINISSLSQLTTLICNNNKLKALDVKNNTHLTMLNCSSNKFIKTLDITKNTKINNLNCADNQLTSLLMGAGNGTFLQFLVCNKNQITSLNVSQMTNLVSLNCAENRLTSLVFGTNHRQLRSLDCSNNLLPTLTTTSLTALSSFSCHTNKLTSLVVLSSNTKIQSLFCHNNNLTALNLDNLTNLKVLSAEENKLTSLNTKKNLKLTNLSCQKNRVKNLDLSLNNKLQIVNCGGDTHLSTVDIRNGNNRGLQIFQAKQSPNLRCVLVDDITYFKNRFGNAVDNPNVIISTCAAEVKVQSITVFGTGNVSTITTKGGTLKMDKTILPANATNKNVTWSVDKTAIATINATTGLLEAVKDGIVTVKATAKDGSGKSGTKQITISNQTPDPIVDIPDPKFRAYLISKDFIDTNKDDKIQVKEAEAYNGSINIDGLGVKNMKGIEAFKKLGQLFCKNNLFTTLDLRSNTLLKILNCENNKNLTTINITKSRDLRTLKLGECPKITSIDVRNAPQLRVLRTRNNVNITQLDISKNTLLQDLNIIDNKLKTLNINNNTALQLLYASSNKLSALDISKNTKLTTIDLKSNELKSINTNTNTLVSILYISGNPLTGRLDLSKNTKLRSLLCPNTELEAINLKNGKNVFLTTLDVTNNPKLKCLQVDDKADFIARLNANKKVDDNSIISETCFTDTEIKVDKVTIAGPDKIDTDKGEIKLTATATPQNATNKALEWTIDKSSLATLTVNADHVLVKAKVDGVLIVKATAKDGSGKFATKTITITNQNITSIIDEEHGFVVFPNPAQDRLTIATDLAIQQIKITDLAGKTVKTFGTTKTIDIGDLNPNMYLLKVMTDNEVYVRKLIKE